MLGLFLKSNDEIIESNANIAFMFKMEKNDAITKCLILSMLYIFVSLGKTRTHIIYNLFRQFMSYAACKMFGSGVKLVKILQSE